MVRFFPTNRLGIFQRLGVYASRWWEFLSGDPREAGMEGGFFPAIWGTVVMTIVMSLAVMPFGVLAALYMREYAKSGWLLSVIRISINNLAGVPSIVYGVFGLSFFCYIVGGYIDGGPVKAGFEPWPSAAWFSALGGLAIVGLIAFAVSIFSGQAEARRSPLRTVLRWSAGLLWLLTLGLIVWLLVKSPHFHGFYEAQLPNPTFGKGCLLWAALTLSLLTLPVVIVATEEA
jgi:ABC-type phosphate transport system permease subunit